MFLLCLFWALVSHARAQSAPDSFDPNVNGAVEAILVQPDGKVVISGAFTSVSPNGGSPVPRNHIARFNPDGTLDTGFDANADKPVYALALQADGKILATGDFDSIGGQSRSRIARLDATTGAADSFNPVVSGSVGAIVVQADGKIIVAGQFSSIGGLVRNNIARLDPATGAPDSFDPSASSPVTALAIQPDGKILVGGGFISIGGQPRRGIGRLDPATGLADSFDPSPGQGTSRLVTVIAVQPDGKVVFGGNFISNPFNAIRPRLARVDANGQSDFSFNPSPNSQVNAIALQADGKILVAGTFSFIGGQARTALARVDGVTGEADSFEPKPSLAVYVITVQNDGKILVGGEFGAIGGQVRNHIARLLPEGGLPAAVVNVSTRLPVGAGDDALIEGFIVQSVTGSSKKILVRALGPSLAAFGISDALANPTLEIHDSTGATIARNDDWQTTQEGGQITGFQAFDISNTRLQPGNDLESAVIVNLAPGSYTAVVRGAGNGTGTGVVDAYELVANAAVKLANIATRGFIQPGDKLMIAGFTVQNAPIRAVVRAVGPSLKAFGINNALPDTTLQLRDQNGGIVLENDDWKTSQQQELESTGLQPSNDFEAALIATIQPGQYTAQVRGKDNASGIGVVEVYFLQ